MSAAAALVLRVVQHLLHVVRVVLPVVLLPPLVVTVALRVVRPRVPRVVLRRAIHVTLVVNVPRPVAHVRRKRRGSSRYILVR